MIPFFTVVSQLAKELKELPLTLISIVVVLGVILLVLTGNLNGTVNFG